MGFFDKIFSGMTKTRSNMEELEELFQGYQPDSEDFYEELEELQVLADVGASTAADVVKAMRKLTWERRFRKGDEAHVGRNAGYTPRRSGETLSLVITHRRGTMEEADMLYGVPMQEKGVSTVIELDLESAQKTVEE